MKRAVVAIASLAACCVAGVAGAQSPAAPDPKQFLIGRLSGGATLERYLQSMRSEFSRIDADLDGVIDMGDIDAHAAMTAATFRLSWAMRIMTSDLDGDGAVTADEMRKRLRYDQRMNIGTQPPPQRPGVPSPAERIEQQVQQMMAADADKDGRVTWAEAVESAKAEPQYARSDSFGLTLVARQILALAPEGKTAITRAEFEAAATGFFGRTDTDGNGTVSLDELDAARKAISNAAAAHRRAPVFPAPPACDMPKASAAAKVVLVGLYETEALSTVAIGSQDDVTGVGTVTVEPGEGPLYLAIVSYRPTIWRFEGAVDRIERAVIMASRAVRGKGGAQVQAAGAIGLPAEKLTFAPRASCLNDFTEAPSIASAQAAGAVKQAVGKDVDVVAGLYELTGVSVPSGKIERAQANRPRLQVVQKSDGTYVVEGDAGHTRPHASTGYLERELYRFNPGGVVEIDAAKVVASAPVERYAVLPEQAGLIQLVVSGALTQNRQGEFLINRKIRFPAGLAGAHSVKFLLRRGVPAPDGDPGHSPVISEETGRPVEPGKG